MALTPEDVSNKRFTPVRLREGYDMGEVDQFLDEVEAELLRLITDNEDLRQQVSGTQGGETGPPAVAGSPGSSGSSGPAESSATSAQVTEPTPEPAPAPDATPAAPVETIRVATVPEASKAAARLLELATRSADELVGEARDEAGKIVGDARAEADRAEAEARTRAEMLDSETSARRTRLFGDLEKERDKLSAELDDLRSFEREYRSRLKSYFVQQLAALDGVGEEQAPGEQPPGERAPGEEPVAGDEHVTPTRLRSILGDDQS